MMSFTSYALNRPNECASHTCRRRRFCNSKFPKWKCGVRVSQLVENRRTWGRLVTKRKREKERNIARTRRSIFTIILSPGIPELPVFLVSFKAVRERGENGTSVRNGNDPYILVSQTIRLTCAPEVTRVLDY